MAKVVEAKFLYAVAFIMIGKDRGGRSLAT